LFDLFYQSFNALKSSPTDSPLSYNIEPNLDLATANEFSSNVSVLLNQGVPLIPTLSEWGMIILALFLLAVGTITVIRRLRSAGSEEV